MYMKVSEIVLLKAFLDWTLIPAHFNFALLQEWIPCSKFSRVYFFDRLSAVKMKFSCSKPFAQCASLFNRLQSHQFAIALTCWLSKVVAILNSLEIIDWKFSSNCIISNHWLHFWWHLTEITSSTSLKTQTQTMRIVLYFLIYNHFNKFKTKFGNFL